MPHHGYSVPSKRRAIHLLSVTLVLALLLTVLAETPSAGAQVPGPSGEAPPSEVALFGATAAGAVGETTFYIDQAGQGVRRVEDGFDLDQYLFNSDGPVDFSIDVPGDFGPVDVDGHPAPGNVLYGKTGRITLRVFDIDDDFVGSDPPEVDRLFINGNGASPALSGANNQWSINTLTFPLDWLVLATPANPNGTNDFHVLVDTGTSPGSNRWAAEIDWAELRLTTAGRPLAMIHGFNGNGDDFKDMADFYRLTVPELNGRVARPDLTTRGSIADNATLMEQPIADLLANTASYNLNVLAHSMGGLDTRLYAWDNPSTVSRFVMMGTPNGGSRLADILCGAESPWIIPFFGLGGLGLKEVLERQWGECNGPEDGLFQLQQSYVQDVFNRQVLDRNGTTYLTIAGTGNAPANILLDGEDDGAVTVASVQYLDRFDPDHPGLHTALDVFDVDHSALRDAAGPAAPSSICALYWGTCSTVFESSAASSSAATTQAVEAAVAAIQPSSLFFGTVASGATLQVPVVFEGAANAFVMVIGDGVTADLAGVALKSSDMLGATVLAAAVVNPQDGTVDITNPGPAPVDVGVIVAVESARSLEVSMSSSLATPGQTVDVVATLTGGQVGDAPLARVTDTTGTVVADLTLASTGDNTWTASFVAPGAGIYTVAAGVSGPAPRYATTLLSVGGGNAALTGTFSEQTPDDNSNGLFDVLVVSPGIEVTTPGTYRVAARLVDGTGATVATAGAVGGLTAGPGSLDLTFDGRAIHDSGLSGPYQVVDVVLSRDDLSLEGETASLGATAAYDYRVFEHFAIALALDGFSDQGIDSDDDGFFDRLSIAGSVRVDNGGSYAINARLVASDRTELGEFATVATLAAGDNGFTLTFPWGPIAAAGIDGPYTVEDLSIYPTSTADVLGFLVLAHTTAPYNAEGRIGDVTFASLRSLVLDLAASGEISNGGITHSLLAKVNNAEAANESGQVNAALNLLEAFRNQLDAQRGKNVSESAYLALDLAAEQLIVIL